MRMIFAAVLLASSAGLALAGDQPTTVNTALPQANYQQSVQTPAPADNATLQQSFYGFQGGCDHHAAKQDTAKLLMN